MKYLVHIPPSAALQEKLFEHQRRLGDAVTKPVGVFHCTVMSFYADPAHEGELKRLLAGIAAQSKPFAWETRGQAYFSDGNGEPNALVVRMSRPEGLLSIHKRVVAALFQFSLEQTRSPFWDDAFNPHFSIADVDPAKRNAIDTALPIQESWTPDTIILSRKMKGGQWVTFASFPLG